MPPSTRKPRTVYINEGGQHTFRNLLDTDVHFSNGNSFVTEEQRQLLFNLDKDIAKLLRHDLDDSIHVSSLIKTIIELNTTHRKNDEVHLSKEQRNKLEKKVMRGPRGKQGFPGPPGISVGGGGAGGGGGASGDIAVDSVEIIKSGNISLDNGNVKLVIDGAELIIQARVGGAWVATGWAIGLS